MRSTAWAFGVALLAQQGQQPRADEQERLQLARQRAAMLHALTTIRSLESQPMCRGCEEGLHSHEILTLADRALGLKHACKVPREWLNGERGLKR